MKMIKNYEEKLLKINDWKEFRTQLIVGVISKKLNVTIREEEGLGFILKHEGVEICRVSEEVYDKLWDVAYDNKEKEKKKSIKKLIKKLDNVKN